MRADLPRGIQAAALVHAAGYSSPGQLPDSTFAVVLAVPDEARLRDLATRLAARGVAHRLFVESDAPYAGQALSIGLAPAPRALLKKEVSRLPLLR